MKKSNQSTPEVIDAKDFDPEKYTGRDVVFVRENGNQRTLQEYNLFGIRFSISAENSPALIGTLGGGLFGWEMLTTRNTVAKMLMTDDKFAETFRGGAMKDIHEKYVSEFSRFHGRESTITQSITDPVNRFRMQWKVGDEVKARGVGVFEAMKQWRWQHQLKVLGGGAAALWAINAMRGDEQKEAAKQDWRERISQEEKQLVNVADNLIGRR